MRKAEINFWTDVTIGAAFAVSAASGIVFLLPLSGESALGVGFQTWNTLHTWSSLLAVGGVVAHLALHWKWVVQMTRRNIEARLRPTMQPVTAAQPAAENGIGRRAFLRYAALGALFAGAAAAGAAAAGAAAAGAGLSGDDGATSEDDGGSAAALSVSTASSAGSSRSAGVRCRKGVVYCPYPGRCHSFRDGDGDGYCDLSIPT